MKLESKSFIRRQTIVLMAALIGFTFSQVTWANTESSSRALVPVSNTTQPVSDLKVPGQNATVGLDAELADRATRQSLLPSEMMAKKERWLTKMRNHCSHRPGLVHEIIEEYPSDYAAYMLAMSFSMREELLNDPGTMRTYVEQNITDPWAHVAMSFFMISMKGMESTLTTLGLNYDPCRVIKRMDRGQLTLADAPTGPSRVQRAFRPLVRPLGMTAGALTASVISEFAHDENIRKCVAGLFKRIPAWEGVQACDKAHTAWVTDGKIQKFVPVILSTFATTALMASPSAVKAIAKRTAPGATQKLRRITIKSVRFVTKRLKGVPGYGMVSGFVVETGFEMGFWVISNELQPMIESWWQKRVSRNDVLAALGEVKSETARLTNQNWNYTPRPRPATCNIEYNSFEAGWRPMVPAECRDSEMPLDEQVAKLGRANLEWRKFLLKEPIQSFRAWKNYTARYTNRYLNSYAFYSNIVDQVRKRTYTFKDDEKAQVLDLYKNVSNAGIGNFSPADACHLPDRMKAQLVRASRIALSESARLKQTNPQSTDVQDLKVVADGLSALECSRPIEGFNRAIIDLFRDEGKEKNERPITLEARMRADLFIRATKVLQAKVNVEAHNNRLRFLDVAIQRNPILSELGISSPSLDRSVSIDQNPFVKVYKALVMSDVETAADLNPRRPGVGYVRSLNDSPLIVTQETKHDHPTTMEFAATPLMTDLFVASMVCGPEADPTLEEKKRIYQLSQASTLNRVLNGIASYFGKPLSGGAPVLASDDEIERAYQSEVAPSYRFIDQSSAMSSSQFSMIESYVMWRKVFYPPRIVSRDIEKTFCKRMPLNSVPLAKTFDIYGSNFKVGNENYEGFLDIIRRKVRPEVIGAENDAAAFENWWEKNVGRYAKDQMLLMRKDFETVVKDKFLPVFLADATIVSGNEKLDLGVRASFLSQAKQHLDLLVSTLPVPDSLMRERKVEEFEALRVQFEAKFNIALEMLAGLERMQAAVAQIEQVNGAKPAEAGSLDAFSQAAAGDSNAVYPLMSTHEKRYLKAAVENRNAIESILSNMESVVVGAAVSATPDNAGSNGRAKVAAALIENLRGLVTEIADYHQYMSTLAAEDRL